MPVAIVSAEEEEVNQGSLPCPSETESAASVCLAYQSSSFIFHYALLPWSFASPPPLILYYLLGAGWCPYLLMISIPGVDIWITF